MKYAFKATLTIILIWGWKILNTAINAYATASAGAVAANQFDNSVSSFVTTETKMEIFNKLSHGGSITLLILLIFLLWYSDIMKLLNKTTLSILLLGAIGYSIPDASYAYYSKQDWAEWYNVLPNHSAFIIPSTGDSKDSQKQFESVDFLNSKKVGSKRIQIPHVVLKNSGLVDAYVPGAILVLLDRTPYVVTWSKEVTVASPTNQEMCVESQDSIEICFNASIGANVTEEDAAKYLYWFGTESITEGTPDERKFPSVLHGKSLEAVVNQRVYPRIHSEYFKEFSKYAFADLLTHKDEILNSVEIKIIDEYKKMGITIEYVGIASQFRFTNQQIQDAISGLVVQQYLQKAAASKLEAAKTDRYIAETNVMLMKATPYTKWDGKTFPNVPQWLISNETVAGWLAGIKDFFSDSPKQ